MSPARRSNPAGRPARARLRVLLAVMLAAAACTAEPAFAAPFSFSFDWAGGPATGFFGWQRTDQLPPPGANPPFLPPYYASVRSGAGPGIRLRPSPAADGTRDRIYSNYDPSTQSGGPKINEIYTAPGTTTIARARIRDVSFLNDSEGQILRAAIIDQTGAFVPESAYGMDEGSPPPGPFLPGVSYSNIVLPELFWPGYATGVPSRLELSLRTICVPAGNCPLVRFQPDGTPLSSGRFGIVVLDLIDSEVPSVSLGGSLTTNSSWVNSNRSGRLTLSAQDAGSGVRRLRLERRSASSTTVLLNETIACDLTHRSPPPGTLPGGACPAQASRSVTQSVSQNGATTFVATATDLSGETRTEQTQIRIDRQRPTATLSGALRALAGRWTNRTDAVSATVAGRDSLSGVSRLQLAESGAAGTVAEAAVCTVGSGPSARCSPAPTARLTVDLAGLRDGRRTLRPVAADLAGNRSATAPGVTLLLDRRPPGVPRNVRLTRTGSGAQATFARATGDAGSPIAGTEIRSSIGTGPLSAWRLTRATNLSVSGPANRSVHAELRTVDTAQNHSRVVRVDLPARARSANARGKCSRAGGCSRPRRRTSSPRRRVAQVVEAAKARKRDTATCYTGVIVAPYKRIEKLAVRFEAENTSAGAAITFGDPKPRVCRSGKLFVSASAVMSVTNLVSRREVIPRTKVSYTVVSSPHRELRFPCDADLDGTSRYLLRSTNQKGFAVDPPTRQIPVPKPVPIRYDPVDLVELKIRCPDTNARQLNELAAWQELAGYNPVTGVSTTQLDPENFARTVLRAALRTEFPSGPRTAWEAHHIIPLKDYTVGGRVVVTSAFRCKLYPNIRANGVYLRSPDAARGTELYREILDPKDRRRTWHPFTQNRNDYLADYFNRMRRIFVRSGAIDDGRGICRNPGTFRAELARIKSELRMGTLIPRSRPER